MKKVFSVRALASAAIVVCLGAMSSAQAAGQFSLAGVGSGFGPATRADPRPGDLVVDVAGITSVGVAGHPGNTVLIYTLSPGQWIDDFAYSVSITAFSPSWLSEIAVTFTNSDGYGVILTPGYQTDAPGSGSYSDSVRLSDLGLRFTLGADGLPIFEFHESLDDSGIHPDGIWNSGTLTVGGIPPVPEPATSVVMGLGLLAVGAFARRRHQV